MNSKFSVSETGPRIEEFLRRIVKDAGYQLDFTIEPGDSINTDFENPDIVVKFRGPDVDMLLANRAELLLALELVTQETLRLHSDDHSRICFDANDYRALRIEELRLSALAAAEKVKHTGTPFRFNPLNSRERRVIHMALRNEPELRSESAGSGPFRHCVIYPAGMASLPDPPQPAYQERSAFGQNRLGPGGERERRDHDGNRRPAGRGPGGGRPSRGRR